jgi:hypothetical protein
MEKEEQPQEERHPIAQTYQGDLAKAMDATDARVVQELLETAREREAIEKDEATKQSQRGWYIAGSIILLVLAIAVSVYGVYYFMRLTVPVERTFSVGVFPSTDVIVAPTTDIRTVAKNLTLDTSLIESRPTLVSLVEDDSSLRLLSVEDFFSFIEAAPPEPLVASIDTIRLGAMRSEGEVTPFLIAAVPDPEVSSKELLLNEPELLRYFYRALGIDISSHLTEIGKGFVREYVFNLPVRTLYSAPKEGEESKVVLMYGYATDNIIVITQKPEVLKAIYETIIRQR